MSSRSSRKALRGVSRARARAVALRVLVVVTLAAIGATPAAATGSQSPSTPEFTLDPTRGVVGSFGGFGGQLNQNLYAKISGPPPRLDGVEAKVVALDPQLVRIFFNTSAWTNADRLSSFEKTVRLADRAGADINVTWQGSTFEFAMNNMDRFADELGVLLEDGAISRLWVTLFNEPNTTQRTLPEYQQVHRLLDRELRARGIRDRVRFMGGDLIRSTAGASQTEWFRYMARNMGDLLDAWSVHVYWDFWEPDKIDERLLREVRSIYASIPEEQRRPLYITEFGIRGLGTFEGEPSDEPGYWPDGTPMSATNAAALPTGVVQHPRDAAGLQRNREMGRVPGEVRQRDPGSLDARPRGAGLAGTARLSSPAADDIGDPAERREHRSDGAYPGRGRIEVADRVRLARKRHHRPRPRHRWRLNPDELERLRLVQRRWPSSERILQAHRVERQRDRCERRQGLPHDQSGGLSRVSPFRSTRSSH